MHIVPALNDSPGSTGSQLLPPNKCYFKKESHSKLYSQLFAFVDFGPPANRFLDACGTKHELPVEEIALVLLKDPQRFFDLAGGHDGWGLQI